MPREGGRFFRDNAFLVAAVSLPLVVVAFFGLSSAIPRWRVPPPAYDWLLAANGGYDRTAPRVAVDYTVRDGRVEATMRPIPANAYQQPAALFLFDHVTMSVREIPVDLPNDLAEGAAPQTIVVDALAGRRVVGETKAPDGYVFENRSRRGPGIVGELFGMNRYDSSASLVNRGRVVPIRMPSQYQYPPSVHAVGWLVDGGQR